MAVSADTTRYLSPDRVAKILDVDRKFVYRLVAEGKLRAVRLSHRNLRIERASLDALLATRAVPVP